MSSLTIHDIDVDLDLRLTDEAKRNKKSKNQLIKDALAHSVGMTTDGKYADDYREFCGIWTAGERETFDAFQADNSRLDEGDWRP